MCLPGRSRSESHDALVVIIEALTVDAWQRYWEDARRLQCRIAVVVVMQYKAVVLVLCVIEGICRCGGLSGCTAACLVCYK